MAKRGGVEAERRARGDQTRQDIITAARSLFTDPGYFETGTADIVARAGVGTRGAFYHHFSDKAELFRVVFEQIENEMTAIAKSVLPLDNPWESLVRGLHGFLEAAVEPEVQRIIIIDGPAVLGWHTRRSTAVSGSIAAVAEVLEQAMAHGTIDPQPPAELARMLIGAVEEGALLIVHSPDPVAARAAADTILDRLLLGLLATDA